jgi:flavin reductase (DIM6/NTAB) family NADH-FMN oxidoreductase RutF
MVTLMVSIPSITIAPSDLDPRDAYRLLISVIVPRPVAWVSSRGADGSHNLAPFSFFNGVGGHPPTIVVSIGRRQGRPKDSLRNIQETGEFVVNIVSEDLAEAMNLTSGEYGYEVDEFERAGLTPAPSIDVRAPRVAEARAALEVRATQFVPVDGTHYSLVLGRVLRFHLQDGLLRPNGLVDSRRLKPVARLGGDEYARLGEVFTMQRPSA